MMPAGPPPTTTTSNSPYTGVCRLGSVIVRLLTPSPSALDFLVAYLEHRRRRQRQARSWSLGSEFPVRAADPGTRRLWSPTGGVLLLDPESLYRTRPMHRL